MKWCSHCMKSFNIDHVIGTECAFWSCADCGKTLRSVFMIGWGIKRRPERARRTQKNAAKETIVRKTESCSTEGNGADIRLIGSVMKRKLKGARRTTMRTTEMLLQINKMKTTRSYDTHEKLFSSPLEWSSKKFNLQG